MTTQNTENKDLVSRLKDAGEDALQKLGDVPGGQKMLDAMNGLRGRVDDLQKRMKRVDELEQRVAALEKAAKKPAPRRRATTSRSSSSRSTSSSTPKKLP
jgi:hypothetical protein